MLQPFGLGWRDSIGGGGLVDCVQGNGTKATGIYLGSESTLEQIDSADGPWTYFVEINAGCVTLINIEWPANCYSTIGGVGSCLTIIGPEVPELNGVRPKFGLLAFDSELPSAVKTIGCSFGLQTAPFGVPQTGQACVGIVGMLIATATPVASTDYKSNIDGRITVAGGTGVSISILDDYDNTIQSGLSALTDYAIRSGMHINFGPFSEAPAVIVWQTG